MSTLNLSFELKYEKYRNILSENFHFLVVKFSVYLNRRVFVMQIQLWLFLTGMQVKGFTLTKEPQSSQACPRKLNILSSLHLQHHRVLPRYVWMRLISTMLHLCTLQEHIDQPYSKLYVRYDTVNPCYHDSICSQKCCN